MAELYSTALPKYEQEIENQALLNSLVSLNRILEQEEFVVLVWDKSHIAVSVSINVPIPPLGTFMGIDIRPVEQVLIVFNLKEFPTTAPFVFTDRIDFPKDQLSHLYIAKRGRPPRLCLTRNAMNDWFSNK